MINQKKIKQNKLKKTTFYWQSCYSSTYIPGQYIRFLKISVISGNVNFFFLSIFFSKWERNIQKSCSEKIKNNKKKLLFFSNKTESNPRTHWQETFGTSGLLFTQACGWVTKAGEGTCSRSQQKIIMADPRVKQIKIKTGVVKR